ncbi:hypothetical protein [Candidatus Alkanophaga liquidiphilum]
MTSNFFSTTLPPVEDKDPARTKHVILKRPQASWAQSVFSVPCGRYLEKLIPNRDYPYEGLNVMLDSENHHFLDGVAVGVKTNCKGDCARLKPTKVVASPWKAVYFYEGDNVRVSVDYYLMALAGEGIAARLLFRTNAPILVLEPFFDIRHMYDESSPEAHQFYEIRDGWLARSGDRLTYFRIHGYDGCRTKCELRSARYEICWRYKLGSGYRMKTDGATFISEYKTLVSPGELEVYFCNDARKTPMSGVENACVLVLTCGASEQRLEELYETALKELEKNEDAELKWAIEAKKRLNAAGHAVALRALTLAKFGMFKNSKFFQDAGDFWFRTVWLRDQFEALLSNLETLSRIGFAPPADRLDVLKTVERIIFDAFELQDEHGRLPNKFPERRGAPLEYNTADATLLAFLVAGRLFGFLKEPSEKWRFALRILQHAELTVERFRSNSQEKVNGAPVLCENALLSATPSHSWTDGTRTVCGTKMPIRVPESWELELISKLGVENAVKEVNKPIFFLPEINAQWIVALGHFEEFADFLESFSRDSEEFDGKAVPELQLHARNWRELRLRALGNFKRVFKTERFLYNLVSAGGVMRGRADGTLGSPAVVALSLLSDFFDYRELRTFVEVVKSELLMRRKGLCFGVLVRASPKRRYYGDDEYHEAMVWPRDTPYLIRLLLKAGEAGLVREILRSNLEHQNEEGFVFYNAELFSPDGGRLTPVKNPVQLWSQWTDPFLALDSLIFHFQSGRPS